MADHDNSLGPRHVLRLPNLRGRGDLLAVCGACDHRTPIWLWQLVKGCSERQRLVDVEAKLRCQRCGNRDGNRVRIATADVLLRASRAPHLPRQSYGTENTL